MGGVEALTEGLVGRALRGGDRGGSGSVAECGGAPSSPNTVHDSDSDTGITTRCTITEALPELCVTASYDQQHPTPGMVTDTLQITRPRRTTNPASATSRTPHQGL